ncbi:MAG: plasma membrane fusion protein prm1 [Thelocarpon impressellum]|nr:MAG: plasma membrane fusion protein prm1 [Thelocarpon impressellum]
MRGLTTASPPPPPLTASANANGLTPYLGLRARLSQVWINQWTVLILLVLAKTLIAISNLNYGIDSARKEALSACVGVESAGSAMASMPHYMSAGANELAATGMEKAVNGLMSMLMLTVSGVEEMIIFVVHLLTSTYLCLITFVITGSLRGALQVVEKASEFLDKSLGDITGDIKKDVNGFKDDLNKFSDALNSVPKVFGSNSAIPELKLDGSLDRLDKLQLPDSLDAELKKLNDSIPSFDEVQNFTDNVIRLPFAEVKRMINETMVAYKFDRSVFPVPQKQQLTFCSENNEIGNFFDRLKATANVGRGVAAGVIVLIALLICIPMAMRERVRWRLMNRRAQMLPQNAFDPLDVVQIASRPYSSSWGMRVASRFKSPRRQLLVRWLFAYATTQPALFVLALGITGLFACLAQYILLKTIQGQIPVLAREVGSFAGRVIGFLNRASAEWAEGSNQVIDGTADDINREVFGWVNTTTGAVNETLNTFVDKMSDTLNSTFGGTVLYDPMKEVLNCLVGLKVKGIQKGLTWISDNAHVDFPNLPNDTFSLGAAASIAGDFAGDKVAPAESFLANPGSEATDQVTNAVVSLTNRFQRQIRTDALVSMCVVLVWVSIVLVGLGRVLFLWFRDDKTMAERAPMDGIAVYEDGAALPVYGNGAPPAGAWREGPPDPADEKVGFAGQRSNAALVGRGHERASSHGVLDEKR